MRIRDIRQIHELLSAMELSKFTREVRKAVRKNYISTLAVVREFEQFCEQISPKCYQGISCAEEGIRLNAELLSADDTRAEEIRKILSDERFSAYNEAYAELMELLNEELDKDVVIEWATASEEEWMDSLSAAGVQYSAKMLDEIIYMISE